MPSLGLAMFSSVEAATLEPLGQAALPPGTMKEDTGFCGVYLALSGHWTVRPFARVIGNALGDNIVRIGRRSSAPGWRNRAIA